MLTEPMYFYPCHLQEQKLNNDKTKWDLSLQFKVEKNTTKRMSKTTNKQFRSALSGDQSIH